MVNFVNVEIDVFIDFDFVIMVVVYQDFQEYIVGLLLFGVGQIKLISYVFNKLIYEVIV